MNQLSGRPVGFLGCRSPIPALHATSGADDSFRGVIVEASCKKLTGVENGIHRSMGI